MLRLVRIVSQAFPTPTVYAEEKGIPPKQISREIGSDQSNHVVYTVYTLRKFNDT